MIPVDLAEVRSARQLDVLDRSPPPGNFFDFETSLQPLALQRHEPHPGLADKFDHFFPAGP